MNETEPISRHKNRHFRLSGIWPIVFHRGFLLGLVACVVFTGIAAVAFRTWMIDVSRYGNTRQPLGFTAALCGIGIVALALLQRAQFKSVVIAGFCGLIVGFFLFPTSSMTAAGRLEAVHSGNLIVFLPFALCLGSLLGILAGQHLKAIRKTIAFLNAASPRLFRGSSKVP